MIVAFTELPDGAGSEPRPLLDVSVDDMDDVRVPCLVDSGSSHTLLPGWLADLAGVSLSQAPHRRLAVAGTTTSAAFVTTQLSAGETAWEADVGFCDPWPYSWGILGQLSFFRFFVVTLRAADFELELERITA